MSHITDPKSMIHQDGTVWERSRLLQTANAHPNGIRSLLVPLDGTRHAEHALPYAMAIARRTGAALWLVYVHQRLDYSEAWQAIDDFHDRLRREKQKYLRDLAGRIARGHSVMSHTLVIESFDTVDALVTAAESADLVVMASRRRGRLRRFWSPSVADQLRRRSLRPMLLVRGDSTTVDLMADPIARRILTALDGSALAEQILEPAKKMARLEGAKLTLLNVQNPEWTSGSFEHTNPRGYLIGVADSIRPIAPNVDAYIVSKPGPIAQSLATFAAERHADVIALSSHADSGWTRLCRGSVIDSLIRQTELPILTQAVDTEQNRPEVTTVVG